ncbi:MAG: FAD-binding oxidoreductase [Acidobacteriaceae bacterium]|nr:FAD-binding oxidoreductase [Acidobacteriaceae bacterium]
MTVSEPSSAEDLAAVLRESAASSHMINVFGNNSKRLMAGPVIPSDINISTAALSSVLDYERNDLTVSVGAGLPFTELQGLLRRNGQMVALDPPFAEEATVGGVLAANCSGPMRRGYGTARDLVIGMTFATLDGKLIKTGGMVVKNVAGLDMGKLLIGSFGTLAVITSVNFRVHSLPEATETFVFHAPRLEEILGRRKEILQSYLKPMAVDVLSEFVGVGVEAGGWALAVRAGGTRAVLNRYARELRQAAVLKDMEETAFWKQMSEFTPNFLNRNPSGVVLRIGTILEDIGVLLKKLSSPCISRSASGVTYVYFNSWEMATPIWNLAKERNWSAVVEFAPDEFRSAHELWLPPRSLPGANSFTMMERVKQMFDPDKLLNRSRLYGRI